MFTRAGVRQGGEIAWEIDKKSLAEAVSGAIPVDAKAASRRVGVIAPSLPGGVGIKEAFSGEFDPEAE